MQKEKRFPLKPHTVRRSARLLHEIRPAPATRSSDVKPPPAQRSKSPYRVILHVRHTTFLISSGHPIALRFSVCPSAFSFLIVKASPGDAAHTSHRSFLPALCVDLFFQPAECCTWTPIPPAQLHHTTLAQRTPIGIDQKMSTLVPINPRGFHKSLFLNPLCSDLQQTLLVLAYPLLLCNPPCKS